MNPPHLGALFQDELGPDTARTKVRPGGRAESAELLCRIRQGPNLPPLPGDRPVLMGYEDKLTAKGRSLYR